jgi:hypothetical protein
MHIFALFATSALTNEFIVSIWLEIEHFAPMQALIPFSLTECLAPREVGELLAAAEFEGRPVEDLVVFAVRDLLESRRSKSQEAQPVTAAKAA